MIAYVQSNSVGRAGSSASALALAFNSNVTAGNLLVVCVATFNTGITVTVTDSLGNTYSQSGSYAVNGSVRASIFYVPNCLGGANTVTVTPSGAAFISYGISEFSGAQTSSVLDSTSTGTGTSTTPSTGSVTASAAGALLIGFTTTGNIASAYGAVSQTILHIVPWVASSVTDVWASFKIVNANTAATFTLTTSQAWAAIGATFKTVIAGAAAGQVGFVG